MELPVYTGLLRMERRLYQIGDVELPSPVTLSEAGAFLAALVAVIAVARVFGLGLNPTWAWAYLVVPWLVMRASRATLADRKRPHLWLLSQLRYLFTEPRLLARQRPVHEPGALRLRVSVWRPLPARRPAPTAARWRAMDSLDRFRHEVRREEGPAPAEAGPSSGRWPAAGGERRYRRTRLGVYR